MGRRGRPRSFNFLTGVRLTKEQAEWLWAKVREGEFASVSHGIRRCVETVMREEKR